YIFTAEKDPTKVGKLPLRLYYGVTASSLSSQAEYPTFDGKTTTLQMRSISQESAGLRGRVQLMPQNLDKATSLSASFLVSKLYGTNTLKGLSYVGDLSIRRKLGQGASLLLGYNYIEDGFSNQFVGRQSLSAQAYYGKGRTSLSAFANRSIDLDRFNY